MRVKMKTAMAGARYSYAAGDVVEVSGADGVRLLSSGQAEPVDEVLETAIADARERATNPTTRADAMQAALERGEKEADRDRKARIKAARAAVKQRAADEKAAARAAGG